MQALRAGSLASYVSKPKIHTLKTFGDSFGAQVLKDEGTSESSAFAKDGEVCCLLVRESALSSATGSAKAALLRCESRLAGSSSAVDPSDLQLDRVLGVGTFGFVKLAYTAGDGQQTVFAVKCMSKDVIRCDPPSSRNHAAMN